MQKLLPFVIGMDGGKALYAGCDMREERWLCDIVQTFQLSNQDPGERTNSVSEGKLAALASSSALEDVNPSSLPGHNVQNCKEDEEGPHRHQEPGENSCDHSNTEEHQDDVLDEHLSLERQAHVDWGDRKGTSKRQAVRIHKQENWNQKFFKSKKRFPQIPDICVLAFKHRDQRKV